MQLRIESFFNPHLSAGADRIDAVITVTAASTGEAVNRKASGGRAIAFVIDCSGSMKDHGRLDAAKHAARVCINLLDETTSFSVIAFSYDAQILVPLSPATIQNKERAHREIERLSGDGGTVFSTALLAAREQLRKLSEGIRYALFLTDGENDPQDHEDLGRAVEGCKGLFQCDGRGIGSDWKKADLTFIANTLLGNADIIPSWEMMERAFREAIAAALAKGVADVRLRLWSPRTATVTTIKQVSPEIIDLRPLKMRKDDKTIELPIGSWAAESRDYHVTLSFAPGAVGDEMLVCRPSVVYQDGGQEIVVTAPPVIATWTSDATLATRISPQVAHYTGQQELADSIREGLAARERGDLDQATKLLGNAARIAADSGNEEVTRRLKHVVDIVDAPQGTVRLRSAVSRADELVLDMGGTRTVRRKIS
jgi:von Willebrand factor type A C-terminal domain/von Willebrand factor type A domain